MFNVNLKKYLFCNDNYDDNTMTVCISTDLEYIKYIKKELFIDIFYEISRKNIKIISNIISHCFLNGINMIYVTCKRNAFIHEYLQKKCKKISIDDFNLYSNIFLINGIMSKYKATNLVDYNISGIIENYINTDKLHHYINKVLISYYHDREIDINNMIKVYKNDVLLIDNLNFNYCDFMYSANYENMCNNLPYVNRTIFGEKMEKNINDKKILDLCKCPYLYIFDNEKCKWLMITEKKEFI